MMVEEAGRRGLREKVLLWAALLVLSPLRAEFAVERWQYFQEIHSPRQGRPYARVSLAGESYDGALPSLADLRLIDGRGGEVPYQLLDWAETVQSVEYRVQPLEEPRQEDYRRRRHTPAAAQAKMVEQSVGEEETALLLDMGAGAKVHNAVEIDAATGDYWCLVTVRSSADGRTWREIKRDEVLFDLGGDGRRFSKNWVEYPATKDRFLRLVLRAQEGGARRVSAVTVFYRQRVPGDEEARDFTVTAQGVDGKKSYWQVEFGGQRLPVDRLEIAAADENFRRPMQIMVPGDKKNPWRGAAAGLLWRFTLAGRRVQNTAFSFPPVRAGQLRLEMMNSDNQPLRAVKIMLYGIRREVLFSPLDRPGPWRVYFGNAKSAAPCYDPIVDAKGRIRRGEVERLTLGRRLDNPAYRPGDDRPWTERHAWLSWTALAAACLLLAGVILRQIREATRRRG